MDREIISIYSKEGTTHQPLEIKHKDIEDYVEWHFLSQSMVGIGSIILNALKPYLITALYLYLLWPREISLDMFMEAI